jgi:hypothetical protein
MNQQIVLETVNRFEKILIEDGIDYTDAFAAALYVATISANEMGMSKETFLINCGTLFDHDTVEKAKGMQ